ncbi:MAG: hypothetical protein ACREUF_20285, partial [Solimonas sp.]
MTKWTLIDLVTVPYAVLLRWCLGAMFMAHAMLKWRIFTHPGTVPISSRWAYLGGLPTPPPPRSLGGATCLILGLYPRYVALLQVPLIAG